MPAFGVSEQAAAVGAIPLVGHGKPLQDAQVAEGVAAGELVGHFYGTVVADGVDYFGADLADVDEDWLALLGLALFECRNRMILV